MNNKIKVIALAVAVVILTVWVYRVYQKNVVREATLSALTDTSGRLRKALVPREGAPRDFERDAAAVEAHLKTLRAHGGSSNPLRTPALSPRPRRVPAADRRRLRAPTERPRT